MRNKIFILGEAGQIGSVLKKTLEALNFEIVLEDDADIIALCVSSEIAEPYLLNSNKILLNFTTNKIIKTNVINGIGCSTLSVIKPLLIIIKELFNKILDVNVVTLFPQNALSNKSKLKNQIKNIPIYTYEHKHQEEIENILGLTVNMSHFITPVESGIVSSITIKFKEQVHLKLVNYECFTRDKITWNIISRVDNLQEPIDYMINKLNLKIKENK